MDKKSKFADEGYTIYVQGKNIEITDAIRNYVTDKLSKIEKMTTQIIDIHVVLDTQKMEHTCSILMNFNHFHIKVKGSTDNIYSAIDKAVDRIVKLIRRYKTKLQSHRAKDVSTIDIHVNVIGPLKDQLKEINDDIEAETARIEQDLLTVHPVVAKETMKLKTYTQDEAVMKMEITGDQFLVYRSEEDQKLKLIYLRDDSNYGLISIQ